MPFLFAKSALCVRKMNHRTGSLQALSPFFFVNLLFFLDHERNLFATTAQSPNGINFEYTANLDKTRVQMAIFTKSFEKSTIICWQDLLAILNVEKKKRASFFSIQKRKIIIIEPLTLGA